VTSRKRTEGRLWDYVPAGSRSSISTGPDERGLKRIFSGDTEAYG